jgi:hypothetical protein
VSSFSIIKCSIEILSSDIYSDIEILLSQNSNKYNKFLSKSDNSFFSTVGAGATVGADSVGADSVGADSVGADSVGADSVGADSVGNSVGNSVSLTSVSSHSVFVRLGIHVIPDLSYVNTNVSFHHNQSYLISILSLLIINQ